MPSRIWGHRFAQRGNKPAWHFDGLQVGNQEMSAVQMLNLMGSYEVRKYPMFTALNDRERTVYAPTNYAQIWRLPIKDDLHFVPFGSPVSKDYELIGPMQAAQIWDRAMTEDDGLFIPVETMGILKEGQILFISAELPSFDVLGDELKMYLILYSPMYSNIAAVVAKACVRPVCWNTLSLAIKTATSQMILPHTPGAAIKIQGWINAMYGSSLRTAQEAKKDFERMALCHIKSQAATTILQQIYPNPPTPQREWSFGISYDQHLKLFDKKMETIKQVRSTIMELFGGEGLGQDVPAAEGTVYGLYNAVSEYEDNKISSSGESRALSVTIGDRAHTVRTAYNHCLKYAEKEGTR